MKARKVENPQKTEKKTGVSTVLDDLNIQLKDYITALNAVTNKKPLLGK